MSAKRKFGPWWIDEDSSHEDGIVILGRRAKCIHNDQKNVWEVAKIDNGCSPEHEAQDWSHARLIAAAPELLQALVRAQRFICHHACGDENESLAHVQSCMDARAALAKAKGETP